MTLHEEIHYYRQAYARKIEEVDGLCLKLLETTWKPIDTAPKDGTMVLIAHDHWKTINVTLAAWGRVNYGCGQFEDGWRSYSGFITGGRWWCPIPSLENIENTA